MQLLESRECRTQLLLPIRGGHKRWPAHRQNGRYSNLISGARGLLVLRPDLGECGKEKGDVTCLIFECEPTVWQRCTELVIQQRLEQLHQAKFKHVDPRVGVDEILHQTGERFALRKS